MKRFFIRLSVITGIILLLFAVYVEVVNRNAVNMTYRQKVLRAIYPAWMWWSKLWNKKSVQLAQNKNPVISFYDLNATLSGGEAFSFHQLEGKKVLIVNTASDCGFTGQYADLQKLYEEYGDRLTILAFPANDFKHQEPGSDEEIRSFCRANYGVSFPLMKKSSVIRGSDQHIVFQWLTDPAKNGWNGQIPEWNFSKYLVNENGMLTHYFGPSISPLDKEVKTAIQQ